MDKNELIQFLRDNLSINIHENREWCGSTTVHVDLKVDDVVVSTSYIDMPKECDCSCNKGY